MFKKILDKFMNREVISYLIFGVLTTLVNWAVYGLMVAQGADYRVSTAVAWAISVLFAYIVNKIFVFQNYNLTPRYVLKEMTSFVACRGISGIMEMVFMIIMVSGIHFDEYISKLIVSVLVMIANYVFSKLFIFKNKPCEER